ncbi:TolC family protein [Algicola sagamiensis]|uniref:TolC family protein n=1 Tax=Algicola sagamiensis TaxID=163869 RepID=UPI000367097C|nr:TolC family protein [Algicola sagamiensis]
MVYLMMGSLLIAVAVTASFNVHTAERQAYPLSLKQAVALAQSNDPWLYGSQLQQNAIEAKSISSGTLPDPKLSIGVMNLPTNSFSFDQENMTQLNVGVIQMLPRGDSLEIQSDQLKLEASKYPYLRADRKAKLEMTVAQLWLDVYQAQQTIRFIEKDQALFEQMVDVAKANYSTTVGKTRQQDVIRAQLELVQLDDRLAAQHQKLEIAIAGLNQWLHPFHENNIESIDFDMQPAKYEVNAEEPTLKLVQPLITSQSYLSRNQIARTIDQHPALQVETVEQAVAEKDVLLAKEKYKPQWGVNASYGYRDDSPNGMSRSDFFSVGVTVDLPLFTDSRQDQDVAASIARSESLKTEKLLLMKQMITQIELETRQLHRLRERQVIYQSKLLNQSHDQAEASLTAYTNDDGDFAEVVRARIAELNTRIAALNIDIDVLKTIARLNYFFTHKAEVSHDNK